MSAGMPEILHDDSIRNYFCLVCNMWLCSINYTLYHRFHAQLGICIQSWKSVWASCQGESLAIKKDKTITNNWSIRGTSCVFVLKTVSNICNLFRDFETKYRQPKQHINTV